jgi:predicted HicB family RNase H-like nuclease
MGTKTPRQFQIVVTPDQRQRLIAAAERADLSVSSWARHVVMKAVREDETLAKAEKAAKARPRRT